jgi:flagellar protein FlbD
MIEVTKLGGERFFVNADHIETVESQPDTALVLANGKRLVVREDVEEVVRKVLEYNRSIRAGNGPGTSVADGVDIRDVAGRARKTD